ncbi:MAG: type II toxin-antitoxin system ParD family antitoxin [Candidatus Nanohaloarchaea archaeon]
MTTSVDLPEGLEREINSEIGKGRYKSKSEFIRDAVRRLLDERDKIEHRELSKEAQKRIEESRKTEKEFSPEEIREALGIEN